MKKRDTSKSGVGGIPANAFAFPLLIVVIILHILLVVLLANVNSSSNRLSDLMQNSGIYRSDATGMQARNTIMSETSSNYIQMPQLPDGSANVGPLKSYAAEINSDRRGAAVVERFKTYNVSKEVFGYVEKAAEYTEQMAGVQMHAIALMASVYPLPEIEQLAPFSEYKLSDVEISMPAEQRVALAKRMILDETYAKLRYYINENIEKCNNTLQKEFTQASEETSAYITTMRRVLWCVVGVVIVILSVVFVLFYRMIISPLRKYSKDIAANQSITQTGGIMEMRQLVKAFNGLWESRNNLEIILRTAAENDSLTGLPNRYCLKRDVYKMCGDKKPMAVFMFDVNYLKKTNDTEGHLAGDDLLRKSAVCISECFGGENGGSCYRIGGDEFVAVIIGCSKDEAERCADRFERALKRDNITVSFGYAYSPETNEEGFKSLMAEADKQMYEQKRQFHDEHDAVGETAAM